MLACDQNNCKFTQQIEFKSGCLWDGKRAKAPFFFLSHAV